MVPLVYLIGLVAMVFTAMAYAQLAGLPRAAAHGFLVEELLSGLEVTLEGYVHEGVLTTIGVTD